MNELHFRIRLCNTERPGCYTPCCQFSANSKRWSQAKWWLAVPSSPDVTFWAVLTSAQIFLTKTSGGSTQKTVATVVSTFLFIAKSRQLATTHVLSPPVYKMLRAMQVCLTNCINHCFNKYLQKTLCAHKVQNENILVWLTPLHPPWVKWTEVKDF